MRKMCNDDMDIEEFVKKNKKKIEEILKAQEKNDKEKADKDKKEEAKGKDDDKEHDGPFEAIGGMMKGFLFVLLDPKVQRHFIHAGKEFFDGVEEMIKNAPLPDDVKETVDSVREFKDRIVNEIIHEMDHDAKNDSKSKEKNSKDKEKDSKGKDKDKDKDKKMKKIDVE
jgi:hypothetical protein